MKNVPIAGTVSSAEITRNFGYWQDQVARGPLTITHHGRPRCVLTTIDAWNAVSGAGQGDTAGAERELEYHFLIEHMDSGLVVIDDQLRLIEASSLAALLLGRPVGELIGASIEEIMAPFGFGVVAAALRHVSQTGEETLFDLPLAAHDHSHLRVRALLWPRGIALILRVQKDENEQLRYVEHLALEKARQAHGLTTAARITVRGTIATVEAGFATMVGLPAERIAGVRLVDLVAVPERATARNAIETVLSGQVDTQSFDSRLLTNNGAELPVHIALAPLATGYAIGGAVMIVSAIGARAPVSAEISAPDHPAAEKATVRSRRGRSS
jgi:PAS domain S-box-containing protein